MSGTKTIERRRGRDGEKMRKREGRDGGKMRKRGGLRMENWKWKIENGEWRMENGEVMGPQKTKVFWGKEGECERSEPDHQTKKKRLNW